MQCFGGWGSCKSQENIKLKKSVFLYCRVNTRHLEKMTGGGASVAAAYHKCCSLARGFNSDAYACQMVTAPVFKGVTSNLNKLRWSEVIEDGVSILQLASIGLPQLDRLYAAIGFILHCLFHTRRGDILVLYNFFPEYVIAAFFARLKGVKIILDIEDAPRKDERGMRGVINSASFTALRVLRPSGYLTVSNGIVEKYKLHPSVIVYGSAGDGRSAPVKGIAEMPTINILYGGAILTETGLDLFVDTLKLLSKSTASLHLPLHFHITGFGDVERLQTMLGDIGFDKGITYSFAFKTSSEEYQRILGQCSVGLCLKNPHMEMGSTTFPSKVVEIASAGLLLISSRVSDVPLLFDEDEALLMDAYRADVLADLFVRVSNDIGMVRDTAARGQAKVNLQLSDAMLKEKLSNLLNRL